MGGLHSLHQRCVPNLLCRGTALAHRWTIICPEKAGQGFGVNELNSGLEASTPPSETGAAREEVASPTTPNSSRSAKGQNSSSSVAPRRWTSSASNLRSIASFSLPRSMSHATAPTSGGAGFGAKEYGMASAKPLRTFLEVTCTDEALARKWFAALGIRVSQLGVGATMTTAVTNTMGEASTKPRRGTLTASPEEEGTGLIGSI